MDAERHIGVREVSTREEELRLRPLQGRDLVAYSFSTCCDPFRVIPHMTQLLTPEGSQLVARRAFDSSSAFTTPEGSQPIALNVRYA